MAKRTLASLQKQYARALPEKLGGGGPGGRRQTGSKSRPKNTRQSIRRIFSYVMKYKGRLLLVFLCMGLNTLFSLLASYMLAPIINHLQLFVFPEKAVEWTAIGRVVNGWIEAFRDSGFFSFWKQTGPFAEISLYILAAVSILAAVYLVAIVTEYLQARLMLTVSQNATEALRNDLFTALQKLPVRYFDGNTTGEIMSRFTNDIDNIDTMMNNTLVSLVSGIISLIGTFLFMITTNIWLSLVTVVFIPLFTLLAGFLGKRSGKYYAGQQAALGAVNGYIEETVTGAKVVKVFNHEETCKDEFGMLNDDLRGKQFRAQFWGGIMGPVVGNTSQISYAVTVGIGGVLIATSGFGAGDLTVFAQYSRQFSRPISMISQQMNTIFAALAGAERVFTIMDMDPEEQYAAAASDRETFDGYVKLEHVTFGYVPEKTVLKDISLYAKPGQKVAFVGSTGAGKTTVTNLLNRFYDIEQGSITIDGVDIRSIKRDVLRKNIAMVLQDTHLFTGTIMENIRYGRLDATDDEVIAAAKTAYAHSFITRLENGYQTVIERDGGNLSQGQRQLLNIARAALSKAPILVLDEATSSVDTRTEKHIEKGMDSLMQNRTTFVIAHRLSTVRDANAIFVLEHGVIIERGSHEDLLAQKGRYYELYTGKVELD